TLAAEARNLRELAQRVQRATPRAAASAAPTPSGPSTIPAAWAAPVDGRITRNYGARDADGLASQGVMVRTASGARVVAPANAEIAYAGVFRSYGQVLILNVDGGYALVLTGLETIQARVGETVSAGQTIGQMPSSDTPAPELYVEVRRSGQPVDPGRWLSARLASGSSVRAG
ncbi:MAG TPA: peptidoglycan DD-metalloendopeptidase family protein, partial [Verrucomicrobiae bacterium]|nr:peptidoglycan DD-metalloendopeptidase family protein [Verrucomicrobiae bacterium]